MSLESPKRNALFRFLAGGFFVSWRSTPLLGHGRVKIDFPSVATSRSCLSARRKFLHSFPALVLCLPTIKPGSLWSGKEPASRMSGGGGHL